MYECRFPNCDFRTSLRSQIHFHHIKPKELGGIDKDSNRIWLCPTHHSKVYIPESKSGIHSVKGEDSIVINGLFLSTGGLVMEYEQNGKVKHHFYRNP